MLSQTVAAPEVVAKFKWLGLFSEELQVPAKVNTALDALCFLFERSLVYADGEKDMLVMRHTFEVEYGPADRETITSTMIDFGQQPNGYSSMARTVTLPVAAAVVGFLSRWFFFLFELLFFLSVLLLVMSDYGSFSCVLIGLLCLYSVLCWMVV